MIPFIDLQAQRARLGQPLEDAILRAIPILKKPDRAPLRELCTDATAAVTEALAATAQTVTDNFDRRRVVLTQALAARAAGPAAERARILEWLGRVGGLRA